MSYNYIRQFFYCFKPSIDRRYISTAQIDSLCQHQRLEWLRLPLDYIMSTKAKDKKEDKDGDERHERMKESFN
jgi:hypothetical protein